MPVDGDCSRFISRSIRFLANCIFTKDMFLKSGDVTKAAVDSCDILLDGLDVAMKRKV